MAIDVMDPLASLVIPDGLKQEEIFRLKMYTSGLKQVTKDPSKFTDGMKCAVCGRQHSFEKCPILLNIPFLQKHFINYCIQMNKVQKQMVTSIQKVDATWGVTASDDDSSDGDDVSNDDDSNNNEADFQGEEE